MLRWGSAIPNNTPLARLVSVKVGAVVLAIVNKALSAHVFGLKETSLGWVDCEEKLKQEVHKASSGLKRGFKAALFSLTDVKPWRELAREQTSFPCKTCELGGGLSTRWSLYHIRDRTLNAHHLVNGACSSSSAFGATPLILEACCPQGLYGKIKLALSTMATTIEETWRCYSPIYHLMDMEAHMMQTCSSNRERRAGTAKRERPLISRYRKLFGSV